MKGTLNGVQRTMLPNNQVLACDSAFNNFKVIWVSRISRNHCSARNGRRNCGNNNRRLDILKTIPCSPSLPNTKNIAFLRNCLRTNTSTLSRCFYIGNANYTTGGVFNTCLVHHRWSIQALNAPPPLVRLTCAVPEND